jgi:ADP-ribose pyrophosphatase YjhB (NUDIX family)
VRLAAYAWLEVDAAVLLVRVAPGEADAGRWTLPGGGLEFGEYPDDGLRREVAEETGLQIGPAEILAVRSHVLEPGETASGHRVHAVGILYRATPIGGDLRDEVDNSTDRAAWIPLAELADTPSTDVLRWARGVAGR